MPKIPRGFGQPVASLCEFCCWTKKIGRDACPRHGHRLDLLSSNAPCHRSGAGVNAMVRRGTPLRKYWNPTLLFTGVSIMTVNPESGATSRNNLQLEPPHRPIPLQIAVRLAGMCADFARLYRVMRCQEPRMLPRRCKAGTLHNCLAQASSRGTSIYGTPSTTSSTSAWRPSDTCWRS